MILEGIPEEGDSQRGGGGGWGRAFHVEDSTYKGPEVIQVTECKVHAKKGRKSVQPIDWS